MISKYTSLVTPIIIGAILVCYLSCQAQGELWLRFTFNEYDPNTNPGSSNVANTGITGSTYYGKTYRNGTEMTNATYVSSPGNTAMHFEDGLNDFIAVRNPGTPSDVLPVTLIDGGMSVAYWVRFDVTNAGYMSLLITGTNGSNQSPLHNTLKYPVGSGVPHYKRYFSNPYNVPGDGQTVMDTGQWYHIGLTINGDPNQTEKFYINGQLKHTRNDILIVIGTTVATRIGITFRSVWVEPFAGDLDQIDIYDNTLTDTEMANLYAAGPVHTAPTNCTEVIERGYGLSYDSNENCFTDLPDFGDFVLEWLKCLEPGNSECDQVLFN